jgi:hypothetical protein
MCFVSSVEVTGDSKSVKAAYKDLTKQIVDFAQAVILDPNILVTHSSVTADPPKVIIPTTTNLADPKIAELQTISKKITSGKSSLDDPKNMKGMNVPEEPEDELEEKPRIVTHTEWTPVNIKNTAKPKVEQPKQVKPMPEPVTETESVTPRHITESSSTDEALINKVFETLRKTTNSQAVIKYFVANRDTEVTKQSIVEATGLDGITIGAWFAQTGKTVKAIENTGRGKYRFNSDKV